jgi:Flp pilus assembly protein TadG
MTNDGDPRGQAMVEFAFTVVIFVAMLVGIFDVGRAVFTHNGVAQAARDIARVTSVHPGSPLGSSSDTAEVVTSHESHTSISGVQFTCTDIQGGPVAGSCLPGNWVRVTVTSTYTPVTPVLNLWEIDLSSTSSVQIP